jgi:hypothetical protein
MTPYEYWRKYGFFLAVNFVVISVVVQFIIRGSWTISVFVLLRLVVADLFAGRLLKKTKAEPTGSTIMNGGFFQFYGYTLLAGAAIWLARCLRYGLHGIDVAPFVILILLGVAMLSIARRALWKRRSSLKTALGPCYTDWKDYGPARCSPTVALHSQFEPNHTLVD